MLHHKLIQILCITMLIVSTCNCNPDINIIKGNLSLELSQDYNSELLLKERSLAPWTYEKKQDNERVPQIIYEAQCSTSHYCTIRSKNKTSSLYSLESVPIKATIPVLRKKSSESAEYTLEFETVKVACLCVIPRNPNEERLEAIVNCLENKKM